MPIKILKATPPHIRAQTSVPQMMWTVVVALLPAVITSLVFFGFDAFRIVMVATASAVLSEMGIRKLFRKRVSLYDGTAVITGFLLALMLSPKLPSWAVALGSAFGIVFGKEIFGGLGQNPFNPALAGRAFLLTAFPFVTVPPPSFGPVGSVAQALAICVGGAVLLGARLIHWEIPLLYGGSVFLFSGALGESGREVIFSTGVLLAAFFLVTDPATTPLTRLGERWFAIGSGLLTVVIRQWTNYPDGVTYGILLMNALNPALDQWFRPSGARKV